MEESTTHFAHYRDCSGADGFQIDRSGAPGSVIARLLFTFQQHHGSVLTQMISYRSASDTGAYDYVIGFVHA